MHQNIRSFEVKQSIHSRVKGVRRTRWNVNSRDRIVQRRRKAASQTVQVGCRSLDSLLYDAPWCFEQVKPVNMALYKLFYTIVRVSLFSYGRSGLHAGRESCMPRSATSTPTFKRTWKLQKTQEYTPLTCFCSKQRDSCSIRCTMTICKNTTLRGWSRLDLLMRLALLTCCFMVRMIREELAGKSDPSKTTHRVLDKCYGTGWATRPCQGTVHTRDRRFEDWSRIARGGDSKQGRRKQSSTYGDVVGQVTPTSFAKSKGECGPRCEFRGASPAEVCSLHRSVKEKLGAGSCTWLSQAN